MEFPQHDEMKCFSEVLRNSIPLSYAMILSINVTQKEKCLAKNCSSLSKTSLYHIKSSTDAAEKACRNAKESLEQARK